jgi:hypothetical protein
MIFANSSNTGRQAESAKTLNVTSQTDHRVHAPTAAVGPAMASFAAAPKRLAAALTLVRRYFGEAAAVSVTGSG